MKTHRCKGSLEQYISIRLCNPYEGFTALSKFGWWLLKARYDFDYDTYFLQPICEIKHCPFCGEKLGEHNG